MTRNNDLWVEASFDAEAAMHQREFTAVRVEAVQYWPVLAAAEHEGDFLNRLAIVSDRLDAIIEGITDDPARRTALRSELDAAFAQDFAVVATTRIAAREYFQAPHPDEDDYEYGTCDHCGNPVPGKAWGIKGEAGAYCSKKCADDDHAKNASRKTADADWVWVATHNLVGYMPMNDEPYGHDTWEGAKTDMLEQLDRAATSAADGDEDYAEYDEAIADLKASNGPEWGTIIGNLSYWINKVPRADYEGTPHFEGARHTAETHMPDANNIMAPHCTTCGKPIYWDKKNKVIYHDHGSPTAALHTASDTPHASTGEIAIGGGDDWMPLDTYHPGHDAVYNGLGTVGECEVCGKGVVFDGFDGPGLDPNSKAKWVHVRQPAKTARLQIEAGFTRQHFEHIADTIHSAPIDDATRKVVANHFGSHLSGTNPNFDRGKFVDAATNGFKAKSHAKSNFTRQHFQSIADGIKSAPVDSATRGVLANHFATNLAGTNPNFKRDRFLKAAQGKLDPSSKEYYDRMMADPFGPTDPAFDDLSDEERAKIPPSPVHQREAVFHFALSSYVTGKNGVEYEWGYDHDPEGTMSTAPNGVIVYLYDAETHEVVDSMGGVDVPSKQISDHGNTNLSDEDEKYCYSVAQDMADGQGTTATLHKRAADWESGGFTDTMEGHAEEFHAWSDRLDDDGRTVSCGWVFSDGEGEWKWGISGPFDADDHSLDPPDYDDPEFDSDRLANDAGYTPPVQTTSDLITGTAQDEQSAKDITEQYLGSSY